MCGISSSPPSVPGPLGPIDLDTKLLEESAEPTDPQKCANQDLLERRTLSSDFTAELRKYHIELGRLCLVFFSAYIKVCLIQACRNNGCLLPKAEIDETLPICSWYPFRHAIVELMCCFDNYRRQHFDQRQTSLWTDLGVLSRRMAGPTVPAKTCVDVTGVVNCIYWVSLYTSENRLETMHEDIPSTLQSLFRPSAIRASLVCQEYAVCPNMLWNTSISGRNGYVDLVAILDLLRSTTPRTAPGCGKHKQCTDQQCISSNNNTTTISQLHKCSKGDCSQMTFPPDYLDQGTENKTSDAPWEPTPWAIQASVSPNPSVVPASEDVVGACPAESLQLVLLS